MSKSTKDLHDALKAVPDVNGFWNVLKADPGLQAHWIHGDMKTDEFDVGARR